MQDSGFSYFVHQLQSISSKHSSSSFRQHGIVKLKTLSSFFSANLEFIGRVTGAGYSAAGIAFNCLSINFESNLFFPY